RREVADEPGALWYRLGDVVVAPLLAAWLAYQLLTALPGLFGHDVALGDGAGPLAVVTGLAVLARVGLEELAARLYPARLEAVAPDEVPEGLPLQRVLGMVVRAGVFLFVGVPFVGVRPELFLGTALFIFPQVLRIWSHRLPELPWLRRVVPTGLVEITSLVVLGWWLSGQLQHHVADPHRLAAVGFVVLAVPPAVHGVLAEMTGEDEEPEATWIRRGLGAAVVAASAGLLYTLTVA
ncbi:MAG: hypothetical protein JWN17_1408, partial [Frankiales bacterium]|nr:hypothetical protein [Frankiales bacterium]